MLPLPAELLVLSDAGLYCPRGDFHIDPWRRVETAFITHAHTDHARPGSATYVTAQRGVGLLGERVGRDASIQGLPFGDTLTRNGVRVSLHPAGHVLGSAQVRIEADGYVLVVSGDYKLAPDPTADAFEPVRCHAFITESTFGLPVYRWRPPAEVFAEINQWWADNQRERCPSVIFGYALGKAQRILAGIDASIGPILVHAAIERLLPAYAEAGVVLPAVRLADAETLALHGERALIVAPPGGDDPPWLRRTRRAVTAQASGWMHIRGPRRRASVERGFVLSDHADWDGLVSAIRATGAQLIGVTHGYTAPLARWLCESGYQAFTISTRFEGEGASEAAEESES